ncbi:conserved hypothetical protein [Cupriavidus taiwanensis]|uniref:Uncharacterized protein n=1 Tax=Cupriavidus taiwanensis TaxID=164546 RepID=A0A375EC67_9BURK|nr:hypothetical protein [Cupriavidus taiwanensis]SOZ68516.1 conserved hypothetical protein [Cupriavidus taiwanensis]SOZ69690.1 conserved hypothetical protein [Cupriavidus taiwanensis]SOZ72899.1 conserved hypothetical protein [Cupriavidus taiwanensis]SPA09757.1 conserved hypothetical protein [Cupriavidus taiwanensis]SPA22018.1 conserved hypothetical protein [Cupriavidus taiwanensis]
MASPKRVDAWRHIAKTDFESAFHLLLGRLIHAIARLDFNVGLQLRYWAHEDDSRIRALLKPRTSKLEERLRVLEQLVAGAWSGAHDEGQRQLSDWFERAHKARGFRNAYAHGRWGVPGKHLHAESGRLCDATPLLVFVPLDWDMSPNRKDNSIELTLDEFAAQVEEAEHLSVQFLDIERKFGEHLYPGRRRNGAQGQSVRRANAG